MYDIFTWPCRFSTVLCLHFDEHNDKWFKLKKYVAKWWSKAENIENDNQKSSTVTTNAIASATMMMRAKKKKLHISPEVKHRKEELSDLTHVSRIGKTNYADYLRKNGLFTYSSSAHKKKVVCILP